MLNGSGPGVDELDLQLLDALQRNGRSTFAELGEIVGLKAASVHERVKRLEARGFVRGYTARLDGQLLGLNLTAFVSCYTSAKTDYDNFNEAVSSLPEVCEVHSVAGEESFILKVMTRSTVELDDFLSRLKKIAGHRTAPRPRSSCPRRSNAAESLLKMTACRLRAVYGACADVGNHIDLEATQRRPCAIGEADQTTGGPRGPRAYESAPRRILARHPRLQRRGRGDVPQPPVAVSEIGEDARRAPQHGARAWRRRSSWTTLRVGFPQGAHERAHLALHDIADRLEQARTRIPSAPSSSRSRRACCPIIPNCRSTRSTSKMTRRSPGSRIATSTRRCSCRSTPARSTAATARARTPSAATQKWSRRRVLRPTNSFGSRRSTISLRGRSCRTW